MTAMEEGARAIEDAVRTRAEEQGVAVTRLGWNGDEGLLSGQSTQTLVVAATQGGGRAAFTAEQIEASAGGLPDAVRNVVDRVIEDVRTAAESGSHPLGGGG